MRRCLALNCCWAKNSIKYKSPLHGEEGNHWSGCMIVRQAIWMKCLREVIHPDSTQVKFAGSSLRKNVEQQIRSWTRPRSITISVPVSSSNRRWPENRWSLSMPCTVCRCGIASPPRANGPCTMLHAVFRFMWIFGRKALSVMEFSRSQSALVSDRTGNWNQILGSRCCI